TFKKNREMFFWLSVFIISLLPTLTPLGISWIVAERYVYLGSIGVFVAVAIVIDRLNRIKNIRNLPLILFFAIIVPLLTIRTIVRNRDWKNQDNLWLAAAKTSPSSSQNHNNLGDLYGRREEFDKAIEEFKIAIELLPNYADAYHNLANIYWQTKQLDLAVESYQKAVEINPRLWQSYQNLAAIAYQQKDLPLTEKYLKQAVEANPSNPSLHYNLALVLREQNKLDEAKKEFQATINLDPNNQELKQQHQQLF
ncbi:MAG: tetratricopeptide repeat protein, partial [Patescibacteria group bacterium]